MPGRRPKTRTQQPRGMLTGNHVEAAHEMLFSRQGGGPRPSRLAQVCFIKDLIAGALFYPAKVRDKGIL